MALAIELKRRLEDDETPLSKRIRLAENLFKSNDFPLTSHRNITINWLCNLADDESNTLFWIESIKKCFECSFSYSDIDNSLIGHLIKLFQNKSCLPNFMAVDALLCIINNISMHKYFIVNITSLEEIVILMLESIFLLKSAETINTDDNSKHLLQNIMKCLENYNKYSDDKNMFYERIIKKTLTQFINLLDIYQDQELKVAFQGFVQKCIFLNDSVSAVEQYMDIIKTLKNEENYELGLEVFTTAFVKAYKDSTNIFQLFKKLIESKITDDIFMHQCKLINTIMNENVSLNTELNGETFMMYLQNYSFKVLCEYNLNETSFKLFKSITLLNPLIIEPNIKEFFIKSMMVEKQNKATFEEFSSFFMLIIESLGKLNRVHKLPSLLLNDFDKAIQVKCTLNDISVENQKNEKLDIEYIWPEGVADCWGKMMEGLNASITWGTLQGLLYNLERGGLLNLNDDTNVLGASISTQIIMRFISNFIKNCKLPLMSEANYIKLSDYSKKTFELLAKIAYIFIEKKLYNSLLQWLRTTYVVGEFTIMLKYYWCCMSTELELQMIENYFDEKHWKKLCKLIDEVNCIESKKYLNDIILQNIRYQTIGQNLTATSVSTSAYMKVVASDWKIMLNSKIVFKTLMPLMSDFEIKSLFENSLHEIVAHNNLHILQLDYIQENRNFISIIIFCIFYEIAKIFFSKKNKTYTDKLFQNYKKFELLKNKQEFIKVVSENLSDDISFVNNIKNVDALKELLIGLNVLSLQYLDSLEKSCTYIYIISILGNIDSITKSLTLCNADRENMKTCQNICELILSSLLETGASFDVDPYLSPEIYLKISSWISKSELIQPILEMSIKEQENANIINKLNKVIKKNKKKCNILLEDCNSNILCELLIMPIICFSVIPKMKKKWHKECKTTILELKTKSYNIIYDIVSKCYKNATPECLSVLLNGYNIMLQSFVNNDTKIDNEETLKAFTTFLTYSKDQMILSDSANAKFMIMFVTRNQKHFAENLSDNFMLHLCDIYYNMNCNAENDYSTDGVLVLLENCNDKQFEDIIMKLNKNTVTSLKNSNEISKSLKLWMNISQAMLSGSKSKIRLEALTKLFQEFLGSLLDSFVNADTTLVIFNFFLVVINNPLLQINVLVIETVLSAVLLAPFDNLTMNKVDLYKVCCEIYYHTLLKRTTLILDRVPVIIQGTRYLIKNLCQWSALKESNKKILDKDQLNLGDAGHSTEKVFNALVKLKRNLSRPAYLIHDIINELTSNTLTTDIKQTLLNCCYKLHSLCDSHALKYLNTVSSPANREIFKDIHETYNKFHMFKGKI